MGKVYRYPRAFAPRNEYRVSRSPTTGEVLNIDHDTASVQVNGVDLTYVEQGSGKPVVFVHGALSDLRCWSAQLDVTAQVHRAISYSRRYHHPNAPIAPGSPDPWGVHVDDLAAFLTAIKATRAHLVGNSQGAFISLLLAAARPELVASLVLAEAPVLSLYLSNPPQVVEILRFLLRHPRTALSNLAFGARVIAPAQAAFRDGQDERALRIFVHGALGTQTLDDLEPARRAQIMANAAPLRAFMLGEGFPPLTATQVRAVGCPVLLVTGARSPAFIVQLTERLADLLPKVERACIADASHLSHEEQPEAFNQALLGFLSRC